MNKPALKKLKSPLNTFKCKLGKKIEENFYSSKKKKKSKLFAAISTSQFHISSVIGRFIYYRAKTFKLKKKKV